MVVLRAVNKTKNRSQLPLGSLSALTVKATTRATFHERSVALWVFNHKPTSDFTCVA